MVITAMMLMVVGMLGMLGLLWQNRRLTKLVAISGARSEHPPLLISTLQCGGITTLQVLPTLTDDDRQWMAIFREVVESTDGQLSPILTVLLNPDGFAEIERQVDGAYADAMCRARQDADRLLREVAAKTLVKYQHICASEAFDWLRKETLDKATAEADQIIKDAHRIADRIKAPATAIQ